MFPILNRLKEFEFERFVNHCIQILHSIQTFLELELAYLCFLSFLLCVLVHFSPSAHITVCFANLSLFSVSSHTLSRH